VREPAAPSYTPRFTWKLALAAATYDPEAGAFHLYQTVAKPDVGSSALALAPRSVPCVG
jgi:hypothetical protein